MEELGDLQATADPSEIRTPKDLSRGLLALKNRSGLSHRAFAKKADSLLASSQKGVSHRSPLSSSQAVIGGRRISWSPLPPSTISDILKRGTISLEQLVTWLEVCGVPRSEFASWLVARDTATASAYRYRKAMVPASEADPILLGVHKAISMDDSSSTSTYVERDADVNLRRLLKAGVEKGGFILLVGNSCSGKTRSLYENVRSLLPDWYFFHPVTVHDFIEYAQSPVPQTIVWLDELQNYLHGAEGITANQIRTLLRSDARTVIVATLWASRYATYSRLPAPREFDPFIYERELLKLAQIIDIPDYLSTREQERATDIARLDPKINIALRSTDYGMTQVLAAAPQLVHRFESTPTRYSKAVLTAALDARRLGVQGPLTVELLRSAAHGYLTRHERGRAPADWFSAAMDYAIEPLAGATSALTPLADEAGSVIGYDAADYLAQYVVIMRRDELLPKETWEVLSKHAFDGADAGRLGESAFRRGLIAYATCLFERASDAGINSAGWRLGDLKKCRPSLDELRIQTDAGDHVARQWLAWRLSLQGNVEELRTRAETGDHDAAQELGWLLAQKGDIDTLRRLVQAHVVSSWRLGYLLAKLGREDELRALATETNSMVHPWLVWMLAEKELTRLAESGDVRAAARLPFVTEEREEEIEFVYTIPNPDTIQSTDSSILFHVRDDLRGPRPRPYQHTEGWTSELDLSQADAEFATELRDRAKEGDEDAGYWLPWCLAQIGALEELEKLASGHNENAGTALDYAHGLRGDFDGLRARAAEGSDSWAELQLAVLLAENEFLSELRQLSGRSEQAKRVLAYYLADHGELDELRELAQSGHASMKDALVLLLAKEGRISDLRHLSDLGDIDASRHLTRLLLQQGDRVGLLREVRAGTAYAFDRLAELFRAEGDFSSNERLVRFGITPEGEVATMPEGS
jgi:hypothetical protein